MSISRRTGLVHLRFSQLTFTHSALFQKCIELATPILAPSHSHLVPEVVSTVAQCMLHSLLTTSKRITKCVCMCGEVGLYPRDFLYLSGRFVYLYVNVFFLVHISLFLPKGMLKRANMWWMMTASTICWIRGFQWGRGGNRPPLRTWLPSWKHLCSVTTSMPLLLWYTQVIPPLGKFSKWNPESADSQDYPGVSISRREFPVNVYTWTFEDKIMSKLRTCLPHACEGVRSFQTRWVELRHSYH